MTTAIRDSYSFNAKLKSKGQQRNTDGWTATLDWRLPGSKFDLVLYGQNWDDLSDLEVGDFTGVMISKGSLKQGKDGHYASDFFWDLGGFDLPDEHADDNQSPPEEFAGEPLPDAAQPPQHGSQAPLSDDIQTRIQIGMAFNAAYTLLASGSDQGYGWITDDGLVDALRQLRDRLFHDVIQVPIAPAHFCYQHDAIRRPGSKTGAWVHLVDRDKDKPCLEVPPPVENFLAGR